MKRYNYSPGWWAWFTISFAWVGVLLIRAAHDVRVQARRWRLLWRVMNGK